MKVEFKRSFLKDLQRVKDKALKERVKEAIELVEQAPNLQEVGNIRELRGGDQYYRIRIGDYRSVCCWKMTPLSLSGFCTEKMFTGIFRDYVRS